MLHTETMPLLPWRSPSAFVGENIHHVPMGGGHETSTSSSGPIFEPASTKNEDIASQEHGQKGPVRFPRGFAWLTFYLCRRIRTRRCGRKEKGEGTQQVTYLPRRGFFWRRPCGKMGTVQLKILNSQERGKSSYDAARKIVGPKLNAPVTLLLGHPWPRNACHWDTGDHEAPRPETHGWPTGTLRWRTCLSFTQRKGPVLPGEVSL